MTNSSGRQGYAYSYSYDGDCEPSSRPRTLDPELDRETDSSLVLRLHCPGLASLRWVVKLYSLVLGGLGLVLSFAWVCFHLYVLSMTSLVELRQHRYLDISLGVVLLVSTLCLLYGSYSQSHHFLILFFVLSLVVVVGYWTWYVYVNFVSHEYPVFEDQVGKIGLVLTVVYCVLLVPIMLLYRHTELQQAGAGDTTRDQTRKYPPRYEDSVQYPGR